LRHCLCNTGRLVIQPLHLRYYTSRKSAATTTLVARYGEIGNRHPSLPRATRNWRHLLLSTYTGKPRLGRSSVTNSLRRQILKQGGQGTGGRTAKQSCRVVQYCRLIRPRGSNPSARVAIQQRFTKDLLFFFSTGVSQLEKVRLCRANIRSISDGLSV